jgi:hypothetical protein
MVKIEAKQILMLEYLPSFNGIVYDGYWFYLTVIGEYKIIKCDKFFHQIQCFETCRNYSNLCYDSREHCFWATQAGDSTYVFKLNQFFEQIDTICISIPDVKGDIITGISYNYYSDTLLLTYANLVVAVNKCSYEDQVIFYSRNQEIIKGAVDIFGSFTGYCISSLQDKIEVYSYSRKFIEKAIIPCDFKVVSLCLGYTPKDNSHIHIYILAIRENGEQCILNYIATIEQISKHEKCCSNRLNFIALEGVRIAHILNDEGEKFREEMSSSNNRNEIDSATRAILKTIQQAADIEFCLYNELLKIRECCTFCDD